MTDGESIINISKEHRLTDSEYRDIYKKMKADQEQYLKKLEELDEEQKAIEQALDKNKRLIASFEKEYQHEGKIEG